MSGAEYGYFRNGTPVLIRVPADPFTGWVGTVTETFNDAGDVVHKVAFGDGNTAYYLFDDLRFASRRETPAPQTPRRGTN